MIVLLHPGPNTNRNSAIFAVQVPNVSVMQEFRGMSFGTEVVIFNRTIDCRTYTTKFFVF